MPRNTQSSLSAATAQTQQDSVSEGIENFQLPRSLVTKLARSGMSDDMKMQKEVVLSYQKASTVFINYLAAAAHEVAASKQHKSISASDVLKALEIVEMGDMVPMIQKELDVYRDIQKAEKNRKSGGGAKGKARESHAESASVLTKSKSKGKEKEKEKERGPTITINRAQATSRPAQQEPGPELEADDEEQDVEQDEVDGAQEIDEDEEMLEPEDDVEDDADEEDEDQDEDDEGEGEPEDLVAAEDEELRADTRGIDDDEDE